MKKYTTPTIEIVSLKSSDDIAASYKAIRQGLIQKELNEQTYSITKYAITNSSLQEDA